VQSVYRIADAFNPLGRLGLTRGAASATSPARPISARGVSTFEHARSRGILLANGRIPSCSIAVALILDDGFQQGNVQRILTPLIGAVAPQPAMERFVEGVREKAD
jgi:hypothetical protein